MPPTCHHRHHELAGPCRLRQVALICDFAVSLTHHDIRLGPANSALGWHYFTLLCILLRSWQLFSVCYYKSSEHGEQFLPSLRSPLFSDIMLMMLLWLVEFFYSVFFEPLTFVSVFRPADWRGMVFPTIMLSRFNFIELWCRMHPRDLSFSSPLMLQDDELPRGLNDICTRYSILAWRFKWAIKGDKRTSPLGFLLARAMRWKAYVAKLFINFCLLPTSGHPVILHPLCRTRNRPKWLASLAAHVVVYLTTHRVLCPAISLGIWIPHDSLVQRRVPLYYLYPTRSFARSAHLLVSLNT